MAGYSTTARWRGACSAGIPLGVPSIADPSCQTLLNGNCHMNGIFSAHLPSDSLEGNFSLI